MYVLSREEMSSIDSYTIDNYGIPGRVLMELAGKGCFDFLKKTLPPKAGVVLFCGTGNNGGDGYVIARWLSNYGYLPIVFVVGEIEKMSIDTRTNYDLVKVCNIPTIHIRTSYEWHRIKDRYFGEDNTTGYPVLAEYDAVVDAIFGIGFRGKLTPFISELVMLMNSLKGVKIAVDIPTGLDANTGITEPAFKADYTLTMAAPKYGHYLGSGKEYNSEVVTIDIGIPNVVWEEKEPKIRFLSENDVTFPTRTKTSHKGNYGRIAVIAGSSGYTGAAILSCKAALKSGAGLITLFHYPGLENIFESQLIEVMTKVLPQFSSKSESKEGNTAYEEEIQAFLKELDKFEVLLIGPGLGVWKESQMLVELVISSWSKPAVIDADALNIIAKNKSMLEKLKDKPFMLTPHIGEFSRLMDCSTDDILSNPLSYVQEFVNTYNSSLLLKSSYRLFADNNRTVIDVSGNDGLATGGSGDVLSGVIASFIGQKLSLSDAALAASYLLGTTAQKCAMYYKTPAITPSMIIEKMFEI